ncbi:MAG: ABC transporter ATP-binding protein [Bacteroidetes bacterium]|nr:ABC transporter ATP-binding protein [Bacteroidota bacterium]
MLAIKGLDKSYKNKTVLKAVSFDVPAGSLFGLVGVNGAGKSTLIKCILQFTSAQKGLIYAENEPIENNPDYKRCIGYLPEVFQPPAHLRCGEFLNYCYVLIRKKNCPREKVMHFLEMVGLPEVFNTPIRKLSKGMRQRIGIAQAIIHDPRLLILDEPFSGLDPIGRYELKPLLKRLHKDGKTIFFSSHNLNEIQDLCTSLAILHDGHIACNDEIDNILAQFQVDDFEQAFLRAVEFSGKEFDPCLV